MIFSLNSKSYEAAAVSAFIEVTLTHPIDVYKTLYQHNPRYTMQHFWQSPHSSKFKGYVPRLAGSLPNRIVFWTSQDYAKRRYGECSYLKIGLFASFFQTLVDTPTEKLKMNAIVRTPEGYTPPPSGVLWQLYNGFVSNLYRNTIFTTNLYFFTKKGDDIIGEQYRFISAGLGGAIGSLMSQPFDYVKTIRQADPVRQGPIRLHHVITIPYHRIHCMNGCGLRCVMSFLNMGIGSSVYNYCTATS